MAKPDVLAPGPEGPLGERQGRIAKKDLPTQAQQITSTGIAWLLDGSLSYRAIFEGVTSDNQEYRVSATRYQDGEGVEVVVWPNQAWRRKIYSARYSREPGRSNITYHEEYRSPVKDTYPAARKVNEVSLRFLRAAKPFGPSQG